MTMERYIRAIAGSFVLASLLLAYFVSPWWLWFTAFVGANLLQSAFTGWCPMENVLGALGVERGREASASEHPGGGPREATSSREATS